MCHGLMNKSFIFVGFCFAKSFRIENTLLRKRMAASLVSSLHGEAIRCGELACQKDSELRMINSMVLSCKLHEPAKNQEKKGKGPLSGSELLYEVVVEDTVLFPEGGGQPSDTGTVNGVPCLRVENRKGKRSNRKHRHL